MGAAPHGRPHLTSPHLGLLYISGRRRRGEEGRCACYLKFVEDTGIPQHHHGDPRFRYAKTMGRGTDKPFAAAASNHLLTFPSEQLDLDNVSAATQVNAQRRGTNAPRSTSRAWFVRTPTLGQDMMRRDAGDGRRSGISNSFRLHIVC